MTSYIMIAAGGFLVGTTVQGGREVLIVLVGTALVIVGTALATRRRVQRND